MGAQFFKRIEPNRTEIPGKNQQVSAGKKLEKLPKIRPIHRSIYRREEERNLMKKDAEAAPG